MKANNIEVIINIKDVKVSEKLMGEALAQLINERINKLPIEHRGEVCRKILQAGKPRGEL